jgi:serine/threonine protein kinase
VLATESVLGDRYKLGPIIGRGGGADVYRADDLESGRPVAVKVLRAVNPADLHRFEQEGEALQRLDHPSIVRMCDEGEQDGVPYLVLDLIDGEPLSMVLLRGPLDEEEVVRIGEVLAEALAHAHGLGIIHRDVKPGNVLFDGSGNVHLTDFGIARLTDVTAITATGFVIGTAAYLAPEQVNGEGASPASDIYALGLVLIESLTGQRAYEGSPSEAALARLHRSPEIPVTTMSAVGALLRSMTADDPALRPSASAVAEALRSASQQDSDATTILPVANDATTTIRIAAPPETTTEVGQEPIVLPLAAAGAGRGPGDVARRARVPLIVAAVVAALLLLGTAFGSKTTGAPTTTTTQPIPTTAVPTTAPPTTAAETVPDTTPPPGPRKKKKG